MTDLGESCLLTLGGPQGSPGKFSNLGKPWQDLVWGPDARKLNTAQMCPHGNHRVKDSLSFSGWRSRSSVRGGILSGGTQS